MKEVYLEYDGGEELIFKGSIDECKLVYAVLSKYHKYDYCTYVHIRDVRKPTFKNIDDFFKIYEYKHTYEEMEKDNG